MNDDFDLSNLLDTPATPADGAERARRTVAHRRRRRQAIGGTLGAFVLLAGAAGTTYALVDKDKDVLLTKEAADLASTTTTTTSTTTSTTILDPHQAYVGTEHDMNGGGLPLGTTVQTWGGAVENYEYKVGNILYTWTRDKKGDMLWIERVTKVSPPNGEYTPLNAKVLAVFDIAKPTKDEFFCLGWCAKDNKVDTSVIGLINGSGTQEKFVRAWRVDAKKLTFTEISTSGWKSFAQVDLPPLPQRPDLYDFLATANNEEFWRVTSEENISSIGAGGGLIFVFDAKENKEVAVIQEGIRAHVIADAVPNGNYRIGGLKYDGTADENVLAYADQDPQTNDVPKVLKAWRVDKANGTFTVVDASKVSF